MTTPPGQPGGAAFNLALPPLETGIDWQAGDVAKIGGLRHGATAVGPWLAMMGVSSETPVKRDGNDGDPISLAQLAACRGLPAAHTGKSALEVAPARCRCRCRIAHTCADD